MASCTRVLHIILGTLVLVYMTFVLRLPRGSSLSDRSISIQHRSDLLSKLTKMNESRIDANGSLGQIGFNDRGEDGLREQNEFRRVSDGTPGRNGRVPPVTNHSWVIGGHSEDGKWQARVLLDVPNICDRSLDDDRREVYILIQVHSRCSHKEQRDAVRATWGKSATQTSTHRLVVIFIVAVCENAKQNEAIEREHRLYKDIVQFDFMDTYFNLSHKSMHAIAWSKWRCYEAAYVIKSDDDVFLRPDTIIDILDGLNKSHSIFGYVYVNSTVKRDGLWAIRLEDYGPEKYPSYCSGTAYVMPKSVVTSLYDAHRSPKTRMLPIEDVYVTGMLARYAGVTCKHDGRFPNWVTGPSLSNVQLLLSQNLCGLHSVAFERMYHLHRIIKECKNCDTSMKELRMRFKEMQNAPRLR